MKLDVQLGVISRTDEKLLPEQEVKLLLEGDTQRDLAIMRRLSGASEVIRDEEHLGRMLELRSKNDEYGQTYRLDQIQRLAVNYRLRFLPSACFIGKMPLEAISKLRQFSKDYGVSCLDESTLGRNFYILAPAESFVMNNQSLAKMKEEERRAARLARDPLLFYKIDENHYRLVHKWGSDFSVMRRVEGIIWKTVESYKIFQACVGALISGLLFWLSCMWQSTFVYHICGSDTQAEVNVSHYWGFKALFAAISIVAGIIYCHTRGPWVDRNEAQEGDKYSHLFSTHNWNSTTLLK